MAPPPRHEAHATGKAWSIKQTAIADQINPLGEGLYIQLELNENNGQGYLHTQASIENSETLLLGQAGLLSKERPDSASDFSVYFVIRAEVEFGLSAPEPDMAIPIIPIGTDELNNKNSVPCPPSLTGPASSWGSRPAGPTRPLP